MAEGAGVEKFGLLSARGTIHLRGTFVLDQGLEVGDVYDELGDSATAVGAGSVFTQAGPSAQRHEAERQRYRLSLKGHDFVMRRGGARHM